MLDPNSSLSKMALVFQTYNSDLQITRICFRDSNKDYVSMMPPVVCYCLPQTLSRKGFQGHAGDHGATGRAIWAHKAWNCGTQALACHPLSAGYHIHTNKYMNAQERKFCPINLASKHQKGWLILHCTWFMPLCGEDDNSTLPLLRQVWNGLAQNHKL